MKQHSLRIALVTAGAYAALSLCGHADVVIMKDGKKYENATVLSETADSVTFKYPLTPRIPDTRTEQKANVAQIIKQRPEELEIVPLRKVLPFPDLMTADQYEAVIQDQLRPFVAKYPGSKEGKEVEGMIATLQGEKEKVVSGQMKMDGGWLTPDQVKRDSHTIDGYRLRRQMNELAAKSDWREALKVWDKITDRYEGYTDTVHFVKGVPEVQKILESYKKELERMMAEQPILQKKRDDSLKGLVEPDLTRLKNAIQAESEKFKNDSTAEKAARVRWTSVYKYDAKSIQSAQKTVVEDLAKLSALDLNRLATTVDAITNARRYLADNNIEQAETSLSQASQAAGRDATLSSVITKLKSEASKMKAELGRKRASEKAYGNPSALNTNTPAVAKDDVVAKALEEQEKARAEKKASAASGGVSSLNTPLTKGAAAATGAASPGTSKDKASTSSAKKKSSSSSETAAKDEGGMQKYMLFGGIGLLVVLLAAMFLQKRPG